MLNIALNGDKAVISINDIAKDEGISVAYLEQLLNRLRRAGLIGSVRGPRGGYRLAKGSAEVTVGDIVRTLDGEIAPVHCIGAGRSRKGVCKKTKECVPKIVWFKLQKAIDNCLDSISLEDLRREAIIIGRKK